MPKDIKKLKKGDTIAYMFGSSYHKAVVKQNLEEHLILSKSIIGEIIPYDELEGRDWLVFNEDENGDIVEEPGYNLEPSWLQKTGKKLKKEIKVIFKGRKI